MSTFLSLVKQRHGFTRKQIMIVSVVGIIFVIGIIFLYRLMNPSTAPTPPPSPVDENRRVIQKEPQSSSSSTLTP